jgi:hypothetical protein
MSNTKVTIEFSTGEVRQYQASDKLEQLIAVGEMFSVTTVHPSTNGEDIVKMYAGNPMAALGQMMMMRRNAEGLDETDEYKNVVIDILNSCITMLANEITSHDSGVVIVKDTPDPIPASPVIDLLGKLNEATGKYIDRTEADHSVPIGSEWVHDNGIHYGVIGHTNVNTRYPEKHPITIIYENIDNGSIWSRPLSDWHQSMERVNENNKKCPATNEYCGFYSYACDSNGEVAINHCGHPDNSKLGEGNTTTLLCPLPPFQKS